jgi:hypothetical protein
MELSRTSRFHLPGEVASGNGARSISQHAKRSRETRREEAAQHESDQRNCA